MCRIAKLVLFREESRNFQFFARYREFPLFPPKIAICFSKKNNLVKIIIFIDLHRFTKQIHTHTKPRSDNSSVALPYFEIQKVNMTSFLHAHYNSYSVKISYIHLFINLFIFKHLMIKLWNFTHKIKYIFYYCYLKPFVLGCI